MDSNKMTSSTHLSITLRKSSDDDSKSSKSSGKKSGGNLRAGDPMVAVVVGVVIGVVGFTLLMSVVACLCCCSRRKKKRSPPVNMPFYTDEKGNVYYPNAAQWQRYPSNNGRAAPPPPGWHPQGGPPPPVSGNDTGMYYSSGPHGPVLPPPPPNVALGLSQSSFTYEELSAATSGFSSENLLGQGGFGYVHKGVLGDGKEVAVKQLKSGSGQGEREFQAEVEIISRVHHRHLVSLVGYCISGHQRMLVYEFVPNDTLEHHLHGVPSTVVMDWPTRQKIALGAAKGLAYLHEDCHPRIIHRDIKASNILLDANFEAMVADFGLAKLTPDTNTHVSTRVMGTFGYLAPEYASSGKLTDKSDVFSFGVMLLEVITGRRPIDNSGSSSMVEDGSLVDWARPVLDRVLSGEAGYEELVDRRLHGEYRRVEVERMAASAAASIRHAAKRRPKMSQIVRALEGGVSLEDLRGDGTGSDGVSNLARRRQLALDDGSNFTDDGASDTSSTRRK